MKNSLQERLLQVTANISGPAISPRRCWKTWLLAISPQCQVVLFPLNLHNFSSWTTCPCTQKIMFHLPLNVLSPQFPQQAYTLSVNPYFKMYAKFTLPLYRKSRTISVPLNWKEFVCTSFRTAVANSKFRLTANHNVS